jgi:extracellular factor (EF) 3-hydroxypalmitic acid methyl ester biosynthesis protein
MLAYDELTGAAGRKMSYRPVRYDARRLFPSKPPRVKVRSNAYQLHNISLGGVAVIARHTNEEVLEVGEIVPLSIQQSGQAIFESNARVCRMESTIFGSNVAFNFVDRFIEFDKLITHNAQAQMATQAALLGPGAQMVPKEYRAFCGDVLRMFRGYRAILDANNVIANEIEANFNHEEAFDACEERLMLQWRAFWRTGNDFARSLMKERELKEAAKEYTELVLTPEFRLGAIWDRSFAKPLGYPGDFRIMNQVYDWQRVGNTAYEMLLHRTGLEVAECIKTRMQVVRSHIHDIVRQEDASRAARILSLGCGSAREVQTFLESHGGLNRPAEFTLIDQEEAALRYAHERTYPYLLASQGRVDLQCLHISFMDVLRDGGGLNFIPSQDLIYSVGLFDYLTERRAIGLIRRLYDKLIPGGLMIIGNMNETALSNLWPMEFITDWSLAYRDEPQMLAWAEGLPASRAWTDTEPTGRVRLLFVHRQPD